MLAGKLKLKADGFGTGLADFSATLTFEKESIGKDKYKPVIGLFGIGGQKYNAYKCEHVQSSLLNIIKVRTINKHLTYHCTG
jgi:hypothetical protein